MKKTNNMRIMTYNLHGCIGIDGRYDPERIMNVIQEIEPDILGMQEVRKDTGMGRELLDLIARKYPDRHLLFLKTLVDKRGEYGNAMVSRYPITRHIDIDLEDHIRIYKRTKKPEARRAIFAKLDLGSSHMWVIVTHLDLRKRIRSRQQKLLLEAIHQYIVPEKEAAVFMGDLNEWRLPNAFLRSLDKLFSRHSKRRSFPSRFPLLPLDRIWMSSRIIQRNIQVHKSRLSRKASDHLPLYVDVSL